MGPEEAFSGLYYLHIFAILQFLKSSSQLKSRHYLVPNEIFGTYFWDNLNPLDNHIFPDLQKRRFYVRVLRTQ